MSQDFENDSTRQLQKTDPSGNQSSINSDTKLPCPACGLWCKYSKSGECKGQTHMLDDTHEHLCPHHEQHGAPNNWYVSTPTKTDGPVQRMVGEADNENPRYTNEQLDKLVELIRKS